MRHHLLVLLYSEYLVVIFVTNTLFIIIVNENILQSFNNDRPANPFVYQKYSEVNKLVTITNIIISYQ